MYKLRKELDGLVIGPIDKNNHELSVVCPILYQRAFDELYGETAGYKRIYPKKFTRTTRITRQGNVRDAPWPEKWAGTHKDLVKYWRKIYMEKQWHKYASFDNRGGFNRPYILFKAKNITDLATRRKKWRKGRPITPQTKHPMRRLFHMSGKAWHHIAMHSSDSLIIKHGGDLPKMYEHVNQKLGAKGDITWENMDIEGCFPNMPKEPVQLGLRDQINALKRKGYEGVYVPKKDKTPCEFTTKKRKGITFMPFETLMEIMEFALHNTMITDRNDNLWLQVQGIPMGDPHSPGITIGTCAWMEKEWLNTLEQEVRDNFVARRYMDDVIFFVAKNGEIDCDKLMNNFREECYWKPLSLTPAERHVYLETELFKKDNTIIHSMKNNNKRDQEYKVWRYAHYCSATSYQYKKQLVKATLTKLHKLCNDDYLLYHSALDKIQEFILLQYPIPLISTLCSLMAVRTRNVTWFKIRETVHSKSH